MGKRMKLGTKRKLCLYLDVSFRNLHPRPTTRSRQLRDIGSYCDAHVVISNKTKKFNSSLFYFFKWNHSSHPVFSSRIMCHWLRVSPCVCVCVWGHQMYWLGRVPFLVEATQPSFFIPISPPMPPNTRIPFFPTPSSVYRIDISGW